jgi:hypothetical protein
MSTSTREHVGTNYMSRQLGLPPLVAQAAYDAVTSGSPEGRWLLRTASARLGLRGPVRHYAGSGWWPLRSQLGRLAVGRYRWPVELELLPWSSRRIELGLRPCSHLVRSSPPASVTQAGHDLLDQLAANMMLWAERPLRDWASTATTVPTRADP